MEKIGQTLKLLRQSRNLSQREMADGVMDFSYYNRVENDKVNITFSKLASLLDKIGISMEEFLFLYNKNWRQNENNLRKLVSAAYYSDKVEKLIELAPLCNQRYLRTKQWNDRYTYILCIYLSKRKKGENLEQKYITELEDHLNSLPYFTRIDISALSDFYEVLPPQMVFYLFEKNCLRKKKYSYFERNETNILLFYFNIIDLAFKQKNYGFAIKVFNLAKKEFISPLDILAKLLFHYYDGIFLILSNKNIKKGIEMAEYTINAFEILNLKEPAKLHRNILELMKNKNLPDEIINVYFK